MGLGSGIREKPIPDPGVKKAPDPGSGSATLIFGLKYIIFFDADPDPGSRIFLTLDPGWKKIGSGINIPDTGTFLMISCPCIV
jgi:hypothetical protein